MEQKSYTSQPIQPLKVRYSITKWVAQRRPPTIRPLQKLSRMTVSWNVKYVRMIVVENKQN